MERVEGMIVNKTNVRQFAVFLKVVVKKKGGSGMTKQIGRLYRRKGPMNEFSKLGSLSWEEKLKNRTRIAPGEEI